MKKKVICTLLVIIIVCSICFIFRNIIIKTFLGKKEKYDYYEIESNPALTQLFDSKDYIMKIDSFSDYNKLYNEVYFNQYVLGKADFYTQEKNKMIDMFGIDDSFFEKYSIIFVYEHKGSHGRELSEIRYNKTTKTVYLIDKQEYLGAQYALIDHGVITYFLIITKNKASEVKWITLYEKINLVFNA